MDFIPALNGGRTSQSVGPRFHFLSAAANYRAVRQSMQVLSTTTSNIDEEHDENENIYSLHFGEDWTTKGLEKAGLFQSEGYRDKKGKKVTHALDITRLESLES